VITQCGTVAGQGRWCVYVRLGKCLRSKCGGESNGESNDTSICGKHNSSPDVSMPLLLKDNLSAIISSPQARFRAMSDVVYFPPNSPPD
jgi:hypothetical protein